MTLMGVLEPKGLLQLIDHLEIIFIIKISVIWTQRGFFLK